MRELVGYASLPGRERHTESADEEGYSRVAVSFWKSAVRAERASGLVHCQGSLHAHFTEALFMEWLHSRSAFVH